MVPALAIKMDADRLNRRKFLGGAWLQRQSNGDPHSPKVEHGAVTILVQARPDRLADAERAIVALDGLEVRSRDSAGRLVIALAANASGDVGAALSAIADISGILNAALAHPGMDEGSLL